MRPEPQLAKVSVRAGIDSAVAATLLNLCRPLGEIPWAREVWLQGQNYVVGQGHPRYYVVLRCPFQGHKDSWQVVAPIRSAADLLLQLQEKP